MNEHSSDAVLHVEYTACEVCGDEPNPDAISPEYVYSLAPEDRDGEAVATYASMGRSTAPSRVRPSVSRQSSGYTWREAVTTEK